MVDARETSTCHNEHLNQCVQWAGQTAEGLPAEYLNSVEVIFAAAPSTGRSGLHSDVAQQASESDQRSRADSFTGKIKKCSRGRVVYHQKVFPGTECKYLLKCICLQGYCFPYDSTYL
jgi:hypothetical protein